jgi:hypothetical protein
MGDFSNDLEFHQAMLSMHRDIVKLPSNVWHELQGKRGVRFAPCKVRDAFGLSAPCLC